MAEGKEESERKCDFLFLRNEGKRKVNKAYFLGPVNWIQFSMGQENKTAVKAAYTD